jgi:hypothetical protein
LMHTVCSLPCSQNQLPQQAPVHTITLNAPRCFVVLSHLRLVFLFTFLRGGGRIVRQDTIWPIVTAPHDGWWRVCSKRWNDWQGKPKYYEKTCLSAALSIINHT